METEVPPLSKSEVASILQAADIAVGRNSDDFNTYFEYITGAFDETAGAMAEAEYDALLGVLQKNPPPEVLKAIKARAESNARDLITNMTKAELRKAQGQIAAAVADGKGPREVARKLDAVKGLDNNRAAQYEKYVASLEDMDLTAAEIEKRSEAAYKQLLRERKENIAQTEMRMATSGLNEAQAKARGAKFKAWQTSSDSRVSAECAANEAQGPIPIGDTFTSGAKFSPQHPGCRCSVTYFTSGKLIEGVKKRQEERASRTAAARAEAEE